MGAEQGEDSDGRRAAGDDEGTRRRRRRDRRWVSLQRGGGWLGFAWGGRWSEEKETKMGGSGRLTPVNPPLIYISFFISIIVTDFDRSVKITDTSGFLTDQSESVEILFDGL